MTLREAMMIADEIFSDRNEEIKWKKILILLKIQQKIKHL